MSSPRSAGNINVSQQKPSEDSKLLTKEQPVYRTWESIRKERANGNPSESQVAEDAARAEARGAAEGVLRETSPGMRGASHGAVLGSPSRSGGSPHPPLPTGSLGRSSGVVGGYPGSSRDGFRTWDEIRQKRTQERGG